MKYKILIVDDDINIKTMLKLALDMDYEVFTAKNSAEARDAIGHADIDICLLDLKLGNEDGMDVLKMIKELRPSVSVIMMTAYGSIKSSVEAMKAGATTYLSKPLDLEELYLQLEKLIEVKELNKRIDQLKNELIEHDSLSRIIGRSPAIERLKQQINRLKNNNVNILVYGESGTGKELVARALHYSGVRGSSNFVPLNCAAIPEDLLEEEMFGHKKGAFTGAYTDTKGKFALADKGTLFLDEIGDMPLHLQSKLLRVLETKEYYPIGSTEKKSVDVRVIAATNRDLKKMVDEGTFRGDLFYRLSVITVNIPAMNERKEDLPLLEKYFIDIYNKKHSKNIKGLSENAARALACYDFPGNVRELINILEYGVIFSSDDYIHTCDLPDNVREFAKAAAGRGAAMRPAKSGGSSYSGMTLSAVEKKVITETLIENSWNIPKTAAQLGVSDKGLRNKIKAFNIEKK